MLPPNPPIAARATLGVLLLFWMTNARPSPTLPTVAVIWNWNSTPKPPSTCCGVLNQAAPRALGAVWVSARTPPLTKGTQAVGLISPALGLSSTPPTKESVQPGADI